jgi:hypothetical protein
MPVLIEDSDESISSPGRSPRGTHDLASPLIIPTICEPELVNIELVEEP